MKHITKILTIIIIFTTVTPNDAHAKGSHSSHSHSNSAHTTAKMRSHINTQISRIQKPSNQQPFTHNQILTYWLLFHNANSNTQKQILKLKQRSNSTLYTITVKHNNKDRVLVVTPEQYKKVQKDMKIHVINGNVYLKK